MRYDLKLIEAVCEEVGLHGAYRTPETFAIELADGIVLCFHNDESEKDCLVEFEGTPWHTHGDFVFSGHGYSLEMSYLDVVAGIGDGRILICEYWKSALLVDRWLVHRDYVDEFRYMEEGDDIRIRWLPTQRNLSDL